MKKAFGEILDALTTTIDTFVEFADIDMRESDSFMGIIKNTGSATNDLDIAVREYPFYDDEAVYDTIDTATVADGASNVTSLWPATGQRIKIYVKPNGAGNHTTVGGTWGSKLVGGK